MMKVHYSSAMLTLLTLLTSLLLSACGGGGSGGGNRAAPDPPPPPPVVIEPGLRVSGTITATASQAVDSDTNDTTSPGISNDDFGSAQALPNPITLGGYVNQPGTGAVGRSQQSGDREDFYRVAMLAGQRITLLVADYRAADADLLLYDDNGELIDFSLATGEIESLVAPADGNYLVNVSSFDGATNYILAIGTGNSARAPPPPAIVPWQTVVTYRDEIKGQASTRRMAMELRGGGPGRARLLSLGQGNTDQAILNNRLGSAIDKYQAIANPELQARFATLMTVKRLRKDPAVARAEPNYRVHGYFTPDDEAFPFQWHYPLISLPEAWDTTTGDPGVVVAVIDTGILSGHPDLQGQLVAGYDFVRNPANAGDGDGIDPNPEDSGNLFAPASSSFHGTHVAGTVAAAGNNRIGVTGVAYGARVMPLRALGMDGGGTSYDVDQAIRYAAGLPNDSGQTPPQAVDIINLSLGGAPFSQITQDLLREVRQAGIAVVAAAGNEASSAPAYPASYDTVISVSAVDIQRRLTPYSNRGSNIDVAAPGGFNGVDVNGDGYPDGVLSTGGSGADFAYTFLNGTSMAAPHVAGVLALMKSANQALTPADMDALLDSGALTDDLGNPGRDDSFGHGLINAARAVRAALEASGNPPADNPRLRASASTLSFGIGNQPLLLDLGNAGKGELTLQEIVTTQPWLQLAPLQVDQAGLGQYEVSIDRRGLAAGLYAGEIIARSSVNEVRVRVIMSVGDSGTSADVGTLYVLLYDPLADDVVAEAAIDSDGGDYRFVLDDVPPGNYELIAGSDADNDLFICDPGEACGAWLTLDQPLQLQLQESRDDLDFPVEYQIFIPDISAASQRTAPRPARIKPRPNQNQRGEGRLLH